MENNRKYTVRDGCHIAIFTALIAVLAQISIPMPYGVPLTLQTFAIPLAGVVLGARKGTLSAVVYVLMGALGLPVFAGFSGGPGALLGPTGGFILSFPLMALLAGLGARGESRWKLGAGLAAGAVANYAFGTLLFCVVTSSGVAAGLAACVVPFIPTAIIKAALAGVLGVRIKKAAVKLRVLA